MAFQVGHVGRMGHHINVVVRVHETKGPQAEGENGDHIWTGFIGEGWLPKEAGDVT